MMKLENWALYCGTNNPYLPPELQIIQLTGIVYGSEKFEDGTNIITSGITDSEIDGDIIKITTYGGSVYELGKVLDIYEELYPNARQRIVDTIEAKNGHKPTTVV